MHLLLRFRRASMQGFTLFELAIVLVIISIFTSGGIVLMRKAIEGKQAQETQDKLRIIQQALLDYRRAFWRLPCPADSSLNMTSANYGVEAANPGSCDTANRSSGNSKGGMVPVKTLGLPDDMAIDGWGRRMQYIVDDRFTYTNAFATIAADDTTTRLTVQDASGGNRTTLAAYVVFSSGQNGFGAYPRQGGSKITRSSSNTEEQLNCHCASDGSNAAFSSTFVQKQPVISTSDPINYNFDDILVYATRADLRGVSVP